MEIFFLEAAVPLTKRFTETDIKSYPMVKNFTSHRETVTNIAELFKTIKAHAAEHHCLLKGTLLRDLHNESRAAKTSPGNSSQWVCLDVDGVTGGKANRNISPNVLLRKLGLGDVSHVVQYSSSSGVQGHEAQGLRCHIFFLLDEPVEAPQLKVWLQHLNLTSPVLESQLELTSSRVALKWPLDVTCCQEDKLIYIGAPICDGDYEDLLGDKRIKLVNRKHDRLSADAIRAVGPDGTEDRKSQKLRALRDKLGLPERSFTTKVYKNCDVLQSPGRMEITGVKFDRGFTYLNLNGGNSWGYYYPQTKPDVVHNFKGEPALALKDINPDFWVQAKEHSTTLKEHGKEEVHQHYKEIDSAKSGRRYFAIADRHHDVFHRGWYDYGTDELEIYKTRSKQKCFDFLKAHGQPVPDYLDEWTYGFEFHNPKVFEPERQFINRYVQTEYLASTQDPTGVLPPTIKKILLHALGDDAQSLNDFLHWLAYIVQYRKITKTAWVLYGTEGTGKGLLFDRILRPLFGQRYVTIKKIGDFEERFNEYLEETVLLLIDESDVDQSGKLDTVMANLKQMVPNDFLPIRAMYQGHYEVPNVCNVLIFSNKQNPIQISPEDRRFHVAPYQPRKLEITDAELSRIPDELYDFAGYLQDMVVDLDAVRKPKDNLQRQKIQYLTRSTVDEVAEALGHGDIEYFIEQLNNGDNVADVLTFGAYRRFILGALAERPAGEPHRVSRDRLRGVFHYLIGKVPDTPAKFTKYCRHHGIEWSRFRLDGQVTYGLEIDWVVTPEIRQEMEEWVADQGTQGPGATVVPMPVRKVKKKRQT